MVESMEITQAYVILDCGVCGIGHGIPRQFYDRRLQDGQDWHCPNGHKIHFLRTENERLKTELAAARARVEGLESSLGCVRRDRDRESRRRAAAVGVATRIKRRVAHGVCPCCRRTFQNLARHMIGQHSGYVAEAKA